MKSLTKRFVRRGSSPKAQTKDNAVSFGNCYPTARIVIYDSLTAAPRTVELRTSSYHQFISQLSEKAYRHSQEKGGNIPYAVIKEVVENLIHAYFRGAIVTILNSGNTIRISDQGPGIPDKTLAQEPGFTTASDETKQFIKGVGSGLPLAKEIISSCGGSITIENNLGQGTVVTLESKNFTRSLPRPDHESSGTKYRITARQKRVFFLVTEIGPSGPSKIANELGISLSSAHRDLSQLEHLGLLKSNGCGKRGVTPQGLDQLDIILNS